MFRVFPPQQCFCTNNAPGLQIDLWLVDQMEFVVCEGLGQVLFHLFAFANFLVDAGYIELEVVVSGLFRQCHGLLGTLEQAVCLVGI